MIREAWNTLTPREKLALPFQLTGAFAAFYGITYMLLAVGS
jgi:hypothetical protein